MSLPNPIVLLDARAKYVHPAFQMTRASTKTVFDSSGRLVTVPPNAIGWDHDPTTGQARGYLAEPSATNLLLYSNDLTQSSWTAFGSSITGNAITGPDGQGMAKLVENNANQGHSVLQNFTIGDGDTIAAHFIAKAGERVGVQLLFRQDSSGAHYFQMKAYLTGEGSFDAPTAGGTATVIDGGITHLGGGFYHVWLVGTLGAGITDARFNPGLLDGNGSTSYQGDGTSGLYLGYCQAEVGSYPTSYIETGAATATRVEDSLVLPDLRAFPWGGDRRFTVLVDAAVQQNGKQGDVWSMRTNSLRLSRTDGGSTIRLAGSVLNTSPIIVNNFKEGRYLIACAFEVGGAVSAACNGAIVGNTEFTGSLSSPAVFGLGVRTGGGFALAGHIARCILLPTNITNADLQSLTALQE